MENQNGGVSLQLMEKIKSAPAAPGCYLYYDKYGNIIYVGKAKKLRSRVRSYFTNAAREDERLVDMVPRITDVAYRETQSELDALMLEYYLIKRHKPWFNAMMKADKKRPFLRVAAGGPYTTFSASATRENDGADYYDGFIDEEDVKVALALLGQVWGVPRCGARSFQKPSSPCIYHSIGGCMAPCAGKASPAAYAAATQEIQGLLAGNAVPMLATLQQQMKAHAETQAYKAAGQIKGQLQQLERLQKRSRRLHHYPEKGGVLVLIRPYREEAFSAFYVADGAARHRADFPAGPDDAVLAAFMARWGKDETALEPWVAKCLTEISADKVFIPLPGHPRQGAVAAHIRRFWAPPQGRQK